MKTEILYKKEWCNKNNYYTFFSNNERVKKFFDDVTKKQLNKNDYIPIEIDINIKGNNRTLDQNALMWALYEIEANEHNGGMSGHDSQIVTAKHLYDNDIETYAERIKIGLPEKNFTLFKTIFRKYEVLKNDSGFMFIKFYKTSSHFNTFEMTQWIDRIFNRLAYNGVHLNSSEKIIDYWRDHKKFINDKKISLESPDMTIEQYRNTHCICEATGKFIGYEGGSIAHIVARGMGGNQEAWKDKAENLLLLSDVAHYEYDNGKGRKEFIKKYPHLKNKIENAVKKDLS